MELFFETSARAMIAPAIAEELGVSDEAETVCRVCEYLAANRERGIRRVESTNFKGVNYFKA